MKTLGYSYPALPNKLFSNTACYFFIFNMSVLTNLQSKFSSPNGSVWHSLPHFLFCHWHCQWWCLFVFCWLCVKSVLPRHSALHCPSSQELLKLKHSAICLRVSSVLDSVIRCVPVSLAQERWACFSQKSSSNPELATNRPQRKSVPTNRLQVGWISYVSHKQINDCRLSTFFFKHNYLEMNLTWKVYYWFIQLNCKLFSNKYISLVP